MTRRSIILLLGVSTASISISVVAEDNRIDVIRHDAPALAHFAQYNVPFALEKMRYDKTSGMVICRSKLPATLKRNYPWMPALK